MKKPAQNIGGKKVYTAHRDFSDVCAVCFGEIRKGQWYVRSAKKRGEVSHYNCVKGK